MFFRSGQHLNTDDKLKKNKRIWNKYTKLITGEVFI